MILKNLKGNYKKKFYKLKFLNSKWERKLKERLKVMVNEINKGNYKKFL